MAPGTPAHNTDEAAASNPSPNPVHVSHPDPTDPMETTPSATGTDVVTPTVRTHVDNKAVVSPNDDDDGADFVEDGDVSPARDGGVVKEILVRGKGWQRAEPGDEVSMMYKGSLTDGTVFDSSYDRGSPFKFKLGASSVIKGWEIAAKTMAKGEKARVTLKPEYAYGEAGSPPKIPPNATLVFEMELIDFHSKKDVFGDGSVIKTELEPGTGWERPTRLSKVLLHIVARTSSDEQTGDMHSVAHHPTSASIGKPIFEGKRWFMLGAAQVPPAWEKIVPDMKKDAKIQLLCTPPHLAVPALGRDMDIPAGTSRMEYEIKLEKWVKLEIVSADDSSVIKEILSEGDGWERPNDGASVVVDLEYAKAPPAATVVTSKTNADADVVAAATAEDESVKSFYTQSGVRVVLGEGSLVDGLEQAIHTMKAKEKARVTLTPEMAFQSASALLPKGAAPAVKFTDPVVVTVVLVSFEKAKDVWSMSFDEKAAEMLARKLKGNELFQANRLRPAIKAYERAISLFDSPTSELSPELKKQVNQLLVQCNVNLAVCFERKKDLSKVLTHCKKALDIEPSNVKALYRRGSAYVELDDFFNASSDLKHALSLSPDNADVKRKLRRLAELQARQDAKDKKLYSNLFGRLSVMEAKERKKNPSAFSAEDEEKKKERIEDEEGEDDDDDEDDADDEDDQYEEKVGMEKGEDVDMKAVDQSAV